MISSTQDTSSSAALFASLNPSTAKKTSAAADSQDRFLKLLVTQMKNQDPLSPMDNAQVTSQMAQLSTVAGIDKLNVALQALSASMTPNQTIQATSMIGHGVLVPGNGIDLSNGNGYGSIDLAQAADNIDITINDQSGALVRTIHLGEQPAGMAGWQWDGKSNSGAIVADGSYTYAAKASLGGKAIDSTALQFGMVSSVTKGSEGVTLNVGGRDGILLSDVRQVL